MNELDLNETPQRSFIRYLSLLLGFILIIGIVFLATRKSAETSIGPTQLLGRAAPVVKGTTRDGTMFDLDRHRGRWVVVNFFATWCAPCVLEHPELIAFSQQHAQTRDAIVVSVAFSDQTSSINTFFQEKGGDWPVIVGDDGSTAVNYGVTGVPESYVVAPNGQVVAAFQGVTSRELNAVINRYEANDSTQSSTDALGAATSQVEINGN